MRVPRRLIEENEMRINTPLKVAIQALFENSISPNVVVVVSFRIEFSYCHERRRTPNANVLLCRMLYRRNLRRRRLAL